MIEVDSVHRLISVPAIWVPVPDMQVQEIGNMIERSRAAQSFLRQEISFDDYLCLLAEQGFDPMDFYDIWDNGGTFL
ncbi:hypothetical protein [Coleofasciculus sp. G2-EDA-02]|uniref:hypothetical protein n=1 Tax=Coleofasciculus sp. G2-EDA-02 TaxID=3069529 RepID=UPI0032F7A817